jgi:hypothetical protein
VIHFVFLHELICSTIPTVAIAMMSNLERLQLQGNEKLTGTVTSEICDLRGTIPNSLQVLMVGCNNVCACCDDNPKCDTL